MKTNPIHVVIADDHIFYREGLRSLLAPAQDIEIIGEAANGDEAVQAAETLKPDVMLMDIKMPQMNGIEATRSISSVDPAIAILMLTMLDDDASVFAAMRAGARGYLLKDAGVAEVCSAIRSVSSGGVILGPGIATRMMQFFERTPMAVDEFGELTSRELEVLTLVSRGHTNESIAGQLSISLKTVRNHVSNILAKLQVSNRSQAVVRARERGIQ